MKPKKFYWKVVRVQQDGRMTSQIAFGTLQKTYSIGKTTKPDIGKLFIYKTRKAARYNNSLNRDQKILKISATGVTVPPFYYTPSLLVKPQNYRIQSYWDMVKKQDSSKIKLYRWCISNHTLFADSVTPIEVSH